MKREMLNAVAPVMRTVFEQSPRKGKIVSVNSGKHKDKVGTVILHMRDKYVNAFRYGSDANHLLREAAGRYGYVVKISRVIDIAAGTFEEFFVKADNVTVIS